MSDFGELQVIVEYKDSRDMERLSDKISDLIDYKFDETLSLVSCDRWNPMSGNEWELENVEKEFPQEEE